MNDAMKDAIDDALRMFLPAPFHEPRSHPMTQPQPTAAALSDADLVDAVTSMSRRMMTALSTERYDEVCTQYRQHRTELLRRLARAESAPGVTIPFEDVRLCITALNEMPEPEQTTRITIDPYSQAMWRIQRLLDAALADAGTEASE